MMVSLKCRDRIGSIQRQASRGQEFNTRFNHSFSSYYFNCNHFGHKVVDCRKGLVRRNNFVSRNMFAPLFDFNIIFHNCNNFRQIARNCRRKYVSHAKPKIKRINSINSNCDLEKVWKRKPKE